MTTAQAFILSLLAAGETLEYIEDALVSMALASNYGSARRQIAAARKLAN